jgi:hypothetical protein
MRSKLLLSAALVAASAIAVGSTANAAPLITNGNFETSTSPVSTQFGGGGTYYAFGGQPLGPAWTGTGLVEWFKGGTQNTTSALNFWNDPLDYFAAVTPSPDGGSFVAVDGDPTVQGAISQQVGGLVIGKNYTLTFDWAAAQLLNRQGAYTEQFEVTFGGQSQFTQILSEPSQGFSGWQQVSMNFTATSTSQLLTFLSIGTPEGEPPMALLDGVSLSVPEPASWAMMILGFGAIGFAMRRRHSLATA